ncbi:MAG TPA: serine/threonine-protein kinase [Candidatus Xenobia bacterium]
MLETGSILEGRYVVLKELRRGKTNVAYLGHLKNLPSRIVAIKVVKPDVANPAKLEQTIERFRAEAERCANIKHPHLAKVEDFFVTGDTVFLVDEYVEGRPLQDVIDERGGGLSLAYGLPILQQVFDAAAYCHQLTPPVVVHAFQPLKIIVMADDQIKIVDFGQSWADHPGARATDYLNGIGSHGYAPIERYVAEHTVDTVSDLYALGATVYTMFSGRIPPAAVELITGQSTLPPLESLNPEVPKALSDMVIKAMATQKKARFQSIAEMRAILDSLAPPPKPASSSSDAPRRQLRKIGRPAPPEPEPRKRLEEPTTKLKPPAAPQNEIAPTLEDPETKSLPPKPPLADLLVKRSISRATNTPASAPRPAAPPGEELAVRRMAPPPPVALTPKPSHLAPQLIPDGLVDLPDALKSGIPPVAAVVELEGEPAHLFGPREIHRVDIEVLSIGPESIKFNCRQAFKKGTELRLRLAVPLLVTGQSLASEAIVTLDTCDQQPNDVWQYQGRLEIPQRLRPILTSLKAQERRVAKRFRSGFRVLSKELKSYQATALDISATGFGFISNTAFQAGDVHEFALDIDDAMQNAGGLKVNGKVVHCVPHGEGDYRIGVHFVNLHEGITRPLYHFLRTFK